MLDTQTIDGARLIRFSAGENRFNLPSVRALSEGVSKAAAERLPLVITGDGKFFCNGLDLAWIGGEGAADGATMFVELHALFGQLLEYPGPTASAINGHAFGAGAMFSATTDFRFMRKDRGYFCFPEVDLGMNMSDEFTAICESKFSRPSLHEAWITGTRYGAADAVRLGFVDAAVDEADLVSTALARVRGLAGKDGHSMAALRSKLHARALSILVPKR